MSATGNVTANVEKKKRQRSPNYPTVGLPEAIERAKKLLTAAGKAGSPPDIAAKQIGFATAHGQAHSVLSALKKFGLVEEGNGRVYPSQRALEILNLRADDARRIQAIKDAALSPPIYRELIEENRERGLPAAEAMEAELVTYKNFNPNAVAGFVKDFRDSLEFAGLSDISVLPSTGEDEMNTSAQPETTKPTQNKRAQPLSAAALDFKFVASPTVRKYPIDISIPRNLKAEISITGEYKLEDLEKLKRQVERVIESIEEAYKD